MNDWSKKTVALYARVSTLDQSCAMQQRAGDNLESILQSLAQDASVYEPARSEARDNQFQLWLSGNAAAADVVRTDGISAFRIMQDRFFTMRKELQKLLRTIGTSIGRAGRSASSSTTTASLAGSTTAGCTRHGG